MLRWKVALSKMVCREKRKSPKTSILVRLRNWGSDKKREEKMAENTKKQEEEMGELVKQTVTRVVSIEAQSLVFALISNTVAQSVPTLEGSHHASYGSALKIPELLIGNVFGEEWFLSITIGSRQESTGHVLPMPYISLRRENTTYHLKSNLSDLFCLERYSRNSSLYGFYGTKGPLYLEASFLEKKKFFYLLSWGLDALEISFGEEIEEYLPEDMKLSDIEEALVNLRKGKFSNPEQVERTRVTDLRRAILKAVGDLDESRKVSRSPIFEGIKENLLKTLEETA